MIHVDKRLGSTELYVPLQAEGMSCDLTTLEYGDVCFVGHGPDGDILIGIERKRIGDLVDSMLSGRLTGHQLPGLTRDYAFRWLLIEGDYRKGEDGGITYYQANKLITSRLKYDAVEHFLLTLTLRGGVVVQRTRTLAESATWIASLYRWWTAKPWAAHRAHLSLHQPDGASLWDAKPGLVHRLAAQLPGIDTKAEAVAQSFDTAAEMITAGETQWRAIPGIGKVLAKRLHLILRTPKAP